MYLYISKVKAVSKMGFPRAVTICNTLLLGLAGVSGTLKVNSVHTVEQWFSVFLN